jgi:hypothetical protein
VSRSILADANRGWNRASIEGVYGFRPMNSYNAHMTHNTENSMETARVVGRPFPKGTSGNPGGRPRGLAAYVRENTDGGAV